MGNIITRDERSCQISMSNKDINDLVRILGEAIDVSFVTHLSPSSKAELELSNDLRIYINTDNRKHKSIVTIKAKDAGKTTHELEFDITVKPKKRSEHPGLSRIRASVRRQVDKIHQSNLVILQPRIQVAVAS